MRLKLLKLKNCLFWVGVLFFMIIIHLSQQVAKIAVRDIYRLC